MSRVLRVLSAAALLVVVAAGCGGASEAKKAAVQGVPPALAQAWEGQASAIAAAASAGNSCRALQLANALRSDVNANEHRLPRRLRSPLSTGVNALADRITCVPIVQKPPKKPPKSPPKPPHEHHGKDGHHGKGDGGGNEQ
jgi:hypothetical protein